MQGITGAMDQEQPAEERQRTRRGLQLYTPAVTASWRLRMLRKGNVPDAELANIRQVHNALLSLQSCISLKARQRQFLNARRRTYNSQHRVVLCLLLTGVLQHAVSCIN